MMPGEDETVSEIDDAALFAQALSEPEPEADQDVPAAPEAPGQKDAVAEEAAAAEPPAQAPQEQTHRIPLAEHLAERERRQQFERDLAEERRQRAELQRQLQDLRNPRQPIDVLANPQAFQETIEERFERMQREFSQQRHMDRINTSFSFAARQHGEDFTKAFAALEEVAAPQKGGDTMLRDRIVNSPDPGEAVMQWYRSRQILHESGGDLSTYRERLLKEERERLAKDPEFRKQVIEGLRAEAASRPPVTQMPPSLNRVPAAASNAGEDDRDLGDSELFSYATSRRRR